MKSRFAILALVVLAAVAVVIFRGQPPSSVSVPARPAGATDPEPTDALTAFPADSSLKFEVLRERALTPYRLRPDKRLILAVAEIQRLAGAPDSAVTAQFAAGRWTLHYGSQESGKLSELPDFPEMLDLLTELARRQAWARGWADHTGRERPDLLGALNRLDAPAALREADRAWAAGSRDAALFRDAAHAYAMLALETPDWAGQADAIAARSLATLSFARALGAEDPKREACLLAEAMGYSTAAREQSRQLSANDPIRLYVRGDGSALQRVALAAMPPSLSQSTKTGAGKAGTVARRRVASKRTISGTGTASVSKDTTSGTGTAATVSKDTTSRPAAVAAAAKTPPVAAAVKKTAPIAAAAKTAPVPAKPVDLEAPFLYMLHVARRSNDEAWSGLLASLGRSRVPSALVLGSVIRVQRADASPKAAEKLLQAIAPRSAQGQGPRSRPQAMASTANLVQHIQSVEAALGAPSSLQRGVLFGPEFARAQRRSQLYAAIDRIAQHSLESLGPAERSRWFAMGSAKQRLGKRGAALQRWYAHLADARAGRPNVAALRVDADSAAPGPSQALRSYEALRASVAPDAPALREAARGLVRRMDSRPEYQVEIATIAARDLGALGLGQRLGSSATAVLGASHPSLRRAGFPSAADTLRIRQRGDGTGSIATAKDSSALARRLAAHPTSWEAAERYATWQEQHGHYAAARRVIERWVARTSADSTLATTQIDARVRIARLHQLEGHPKQGLQLLGDLHRSGHFGAMEGTALILQDLGQPHQALAIAWAAHRRAPHSAVGRALLAELFWRQGSYTEAAKVLYEGRTRLSGADWRHEIAPRYVAYFRTREQEGLQAAEALTRAGFSDPATIGAIATALGSAGLHMLAFELQSRMQLSGAHHVESSILAYGHIKRAKGDGAALNWIRGRISEKDRVLLGIFAHQEQHPELLWSLAPPRLQGELGDYLWLMRAAECMAAGSSHRYFAETVHHLGRARGTYHLEIAKYLLGLREESEILSLAQTLKQRSEVCYFAGLKAEQRGRLRDAADWYFMSVESGMGDNIESRWAQQRLLLWTDEGRPHGRIAPAQAPPA